MKFEIFTKNYINLQGGYYGKSHSENFMKEKTPLRKREYGGEQPYIKLGPFKMRLPIIHHEWQDWKHLLQHS